MVDDAAHRKQVIKRLYIATILCSIFMIVEIAGGLLSGSLAILSDAAHLFADLTSFAVAIAASYLASLPATATHTYGLKRTESLAALFSMTSLAFVSVGLAYEAIQRMIQPPEEGVDGNLMTLIAGIGVVVNVALALVLGENHVHLPGGDHGHDHSHDHGCHSNGHDHEHEHKVHKDMEIEANHCNRTVKDHDVHDHEHDSHDDEEHDDGDDHGHCHGHDHGHGHEHEHDNEPKTESSPLIVSHEGHNLEEEHAHHHHHREQQRNVNLHAAYLHVMGDLAQSVAVFLGGIAIWWKPEWHIVDPILTLGFCVLVLWSTVGVLKSSIAILLERIPPGIEWQEVYRAISSVSNVCDVHDLHIWCISHGQIALSVHCTSMDEDAISNINKACLKFGIKHSTIQVNRGNCSICLPSDCCTSEIQ
uniref:Cation efflux protein transmembrane domain-containing protein n=2 Tax=Pseudo-nitzschia australis TaxID=44445 RepID=A0A7S4ADL9_9STRA|mmetsp:Transcript_1027/g.2106  ORF Transcript_1027/g.2106 Transcript_1027/m.2106 type:complete len:419 (+) Transcript_1027:125-1381(+)